MRTNVRGYSAKQLLAQVKNVAKGFTEFPNSHWLIGVRSNEDEYNKFDDKFYLFYGETFISVYTGTTNTGSAGLKYFDAYNDAGAAILQADRIVYDSHERGVSKGRLVYRQIKPFPYFRDNDKDEKSEELGELIEDDVIYAHIHDVKMGNKNQYKEYINGWSLACMVFNNGSQWNDFFYEKTKDQEKITLCLLNEFEC